MFARGRGARYPRGRGRGAYKGNQLNIRNHPGLDVRDKLIGSRKPVGDARNVIREHVVLKVGGDLRAMLGPKRGLSTTTTTRPSDLRLGLRGRPKNQNGTRPKLVYAENIPKAINKKRYGTLQNTNITVGRGGKVTISRPRGRSIDRDEEVIQPTGIPAHMRRQPSPPPRAVDTRSASPSPPTNYYSGQAAAQQQQYTRKRSSTPPPSPRRQRSLTPPSARPQSLIVSPQKRAPPPPRRAATAYEQEWNAGRMEPMYDYRHRSRSPLPRGHMRGSISPNSRNMQHMHMDKHMHRTNSPPPTRYARRRTPSPPSPMRYREYGAYGGNAVRGDMYRERSLSPVGYRPEMRGPEMRGPEMRGQERFGGGVHELMGLRMDRVASNEKPPTYYHREKYPEALESRRPPLQARNPPPAAVAHYVASPTTTHFTVKVTNLSYEVSEDDVVELFSDIGPLISAKLIAKGHAEVCFVNKKDAKTAIDKYDRRELDGIPMTLKLIEKAVGPRPKY